jgi:hypothetical protein
MESVMSNKKSHKLKNLQTPETQILNTLMNYYDKYFSFSVSVSDHEGQCDEKEVRDHFEKILIKEYIPKFKKWILEYELVSSAQ